MEIEIGGSGRHGWIDLVEAVCLGATPSIYEFMRNSKRPGALENLENIVKSGFRHIYIERERERERTPTHPPTHPSLLSTYVADLGPSPRR